MIPLRLTDPAPACAVPPRRLRIAQLVTRMDVGGVPDHVATLAAGLARDHAVSVLAAAFHPAHAARLAAAGVDMAAVPFARLPDPVRDLAALRALRAAFAKGRFDLVHTHMSKAALLGVLAVRGMGRGMARAEAPLLVNTAHNLGGLALPNPVTRALFRQYDRVLLGRGYDRVIVVSEAVRRAAIAAGILRTDHAVTVPNAVLHDRFTLDPGRGAALRTRLGLPGGAVVVLCTARLVWWKGLHTLIDAVAMMRGAGLVHLLIAGDGPLRAPLEAQVARLGLQGRVRLLGSRDDIADLLSACDIFALSSVSEGMPIAVLEAMAAARPTVASDVGGVSEVVGHGVTGVLVPPGDASAFAAALSRLAADPAARAGMGRAARARVVSEHAPESMVARTRAVYARLIAEHRGAVAGGVPVRGGAGA